jgi:hypothetical protein
VAVLFFAKTFVAFFGYKLTYFGRKFEILRRV